MAAEREGALLPHVLDVTRWQTEHRTLGERAAAIEAQLLIRRREHLRHTLDHPAPYLTAALGPLPNQPRARRTWQQAAQRIEAYRFDHAVGDAYDALGPVPVATPERAHWQRAQQDLERAQRELGRASDRSLRHEI